MARLVRRPSSHEAVPPAMPRPAMSSAARPTRLRKSAILATKPPGIAAASAGVWISSPALGKRALRVCAMVAGSQAAVQAMRVRVRNMAPGDSSPAFAGRPAATMTVGPRAKPSPRRSGSSAMMPPTVTGTPESVMRAPGRTARRAAAPSASQAVPGGGAPTWRPSARVRWPTRGQTWSTALSWTGTAGVSGLASAGTAALPGAPFRASGKRLAIACIRVPSLMRPCAVRAARSGAVRARCQTVISMSPPRMVRPLAAMAPVIACPSPPTVASAMTPMNRQATSRRRPRKRGDSPARARRQAVRHGSVGGVTPERERGRCPRRCGHRRGGRCVALGRRGPRRG